MTKPANPFRYFNSSPEVIRLVVMMYVKINGEMHYLWRAVDHEGEVLESFVTKERDKAAALKFIKKALKRHGRPKAIVTDGLRSYGAALKAIGAVDLQVTGRWLNNRIEGSHVPLRRRERAMARFRRMKHSRNSPRFTTTFRRSATSSAAKSTRRDGPPHWLPGSQSWPKIQSGLGSLCLTGDELPLV